MANSSARGGHYFLFEIIFTDHFCQDIPGQLLLDLSGKTFPIRELLLLVVFVLPS